MNHDYFIVILLLVINLIVSVIYLFFHIRKGDRKRGIVNFLFLLVFPIVGLVFKALAAFMGFILKLLKDGGLNMAELSFSKTRMKLLTDADIEKELDAVPIEEALIVADKKSKRSAFIDVLKKEDYDKMMNKIQDAVESDDMEVSHYAATFVTDSKARFKAQEAKKREIVDNNPTLENLKNYVDFMKENLNSSLFSTVELKVYVLLLDKSAKILYEKASEMLSDQTIVLIVNLWEQIGDKSKIPEWIEIAKVRYRDSLDCFKLCASYAYSNGNKKNFFDLINEIKRFRVPLDSEALGWIRFFNT